VPNRNKLARTLVTAPKRGRETVVRFPKELFCERKKVQFTLKKYTVSQCVLGEPLSTVKAVKFAKRKTLP
jgi:hypothetical protein